MTSSIAGPPEFRGADRALIITLAGTPVITSAKTLPGLIGLLGGAYLAVRLLRPGWTGLARLGLTLIWWITFIAADTAHTVGHIQSARRLDAPMDAVHLIWGIQANVYHKNDVTPRQHIGRAAGGVLTSSVLTLQALIFDTLLHRIPLLSALSEAWLVSNAIVLGGALIPTPHFDAWSMLKWGVVQRTGDEARGEAIANQAGTITVIVAAFATLILIGRGKWRAALIPGGLALVAGADRFLLKGRL